MYKNSLIPALAWTQWPTGAEHTVVGNLVFTESFPTPHLGGARKITVLLPPSYQNRDQTSHKRYPVIYMQDGQNLFDAAVAYSGSEWMVDEAMARLAETGKEAIVVAIDHAGEQRIREYNPFGHGLGNRYLDWLFGALKPAIDADFPTLPLREHTFLAGSSMGGLIALHALFTRPHLVGGIAALSPSLWVHRYAILDEARRAGHLDARIYLDHGSKEQTARPMYVALRDERVVPPDDLCFVSEPGGQHNEAAWARRFPQAAAFLLHQ